MAVIASLGETATRTKCLQGTARAILQNGIAATTVQDILDHAGVSRRTFYQHFGGKDDALRALFEILSDATLQAIRAAATATDPVERTLQQADTYLALWQADPKVSLLLLTEAMRAGSPLAPVRRRMLDAFSEDGARAYEHATGRAVDPLVFRALSLAMEGLLSHVAESSDVGYARVRAVFEGIVRSLFATEGAALPPAPGRSRSE